jgi:two-component system, NarL family, sensor kinase
MGKFPNRQLGSSDEMRSSMWILARCSQSRPSRAQLESLLVERTIALEKLTQRLLKLQDEERRRIARNLHDVTGQTLAALKMAVAELERKMQRDSCTSTVLSEIDALAEQALQEIRTMSYLLHPPLLDEIGFNAAAEWYVEGFAKRSGINAKLDFAKGSERLPLAIETALFRVLQESLTNVHRYSGSSEVSIHFQRQTEAVMLEVADRGCGMPPEVLQRLSEGCAEIGVGLAGMRERLRELNGNLEINSNGSGTILRAIVPLFVKEQPALYLDYLPGAFPATTYSSYSSASRAA